MTKWKEPNRKGKAPSMSIDAVTEKLGYASRTSVYRLVKLGPENGGLAGYILDRTSWIRANGKHGGRETVFYPEDVETWQKQNQPLKSYSGYSEEEKQLVLDRASNISRPICIKAFAEYIGWHTIPRKAKIKRILDDAGIANKSYSEEEKALVLAEAEKIKEANGTVSRVKLRKSLITSYPGDGWGTPSRYAIIQQILHDADIPLPARAPGAGSSARRKIPTRQGVAWKS